MRCRLLVATLLLLALAQDLQAAQGAAKGVPAQQKRRSWACKLPPRRGVHLPELSLPAWFRFNNWPKIAKAHAEPFPYPYSGQDQEDKFAYEHFFFKQAGGTYLEFGAAAGKEWSNTDWFHKSLGWRGVLIEANPTSYRQLIANRPADINVHAAVCANFTTVHYLSQGWTGGIWEFMSPSFRQQWAPNTTVAELPEVMCMPLTPLLAKFNLRHVHFWSLDVEGGELEVLKTVNFNCITFDVIVVEADGHNPSKDQAVRTLLLSKGFELYQASKGRDTNERNDWFVHTKFVPSRRPEQLDTA